jgi:hypothetical protein
MPAHPWDITGPDTSTTASFWAWAHGPAGVMTTAGEAIASSAMVEEAITAEPAALLTAEVQAAGRQHAAAERVRTAELPMQVGRVPAELVPHRRPRLRAPQQGRPQHRAPRLRKAAEDKPAVAAAQRTAAAVVKLGLAVVHHAAVATASNRSAQHQAAELTGSAAFHLGNLGRSSSP